MADYTQQNIQPIIEIRWHARAGQGAVTASKLLAETALKLDKYIQAMPEYGPERTGAPLRAYSRISDAPIEVHNNIVSPSIVVILDETLLDIVDVLEGLPNDGLVVINTPKSPQEIRSKLGATATMKVATVDASKIALATIGRDMPNTPIVGALVQVSQIVPLDNLLDNLKTTFGKKFADKVIEANLESVRQAAKQVKVS